MREDLFILALMIIAVPLTGELKFYPFHDTFRVSFGTPIFLFFLLWIRKIPLILTGSLIGLFVVGFRICLDFIIQGNFVLKNDFIFHFSSFFYYLIYSGIFYVTGVNKLHNKPLIVGSLAVFSDIAASLIELLLRQSILGNKIQLSTLGLIVVISIIRSFFVLGFFNIVKLNELKITSAQKEEQNKHMTLLISSLYEESIQLKKSLQYAEDITRNCYILYENLQNKAYSFNRKTLAENLLKIAGEVHEIKKDNQRIYAGLSNMISKENSIDYMKVSEISDIIVETNKKYAYSLKKQVDFLKDIDETLPPLHVYIILSLVNNLVSNSIEAIEEKGVIKVSINKIENLVQFKISDNGKGIPEKKIKLIFKPGYTTKYDLHGKPSTGMGLSYVKEVVNSLKGTIELNYDLNKKETNFIINIPISSLVKKG